MDRTTKATLYYTVRSTSLNMHIGPSPPSYRLTGNSVMEHTQLLLVYYTRRQLHTYGLDSFH